MAANQSDESELLARARAGEAAAVDTLIGRYLKDVYSVTARVLQDRELAQDAAQDALLNALKGLARFRGEASFRTWLLRIAMNSARSAARRRTRRREISLDVVTEAAVDEPDAAALAGDRADAGRALTQLAQLPEKQRLAVTLRIQQGLSYAEIASLIKCSEGAARVNYHLGVKRLRELMK